MCCDYTPTPTLNNSSKFPNPADDDDDATIVTSNCSKCKASDAATVETAELTDLESDSDSASDSDEPENDVACAAHEHTALHPSASNEPENDAACEAQKRTALHLEPSLAIADSGATAHFILPRVRIRNKQKAIHPLTITLPDGEVIRSTHTGHLTLPGLPPAATLAHVVPGLAHSSLISVKQLCDHGCTVIFSKK